MQREEPLVNISIQDIMTVDECDDLIYELKDIINQLKKKRSELLLEMIESHEYKEIIVMKEIENDQKTYQYEYIKHQPKKSIELKRYFI